MVPRDAKDAALLLAAAAANGHADAEYTLAMKHYHGLPPFDSSSPDWTAAARLFRVAADNGSVDAMYNLGVMLGTGRGVAPDRTEAHKLFTRAAKLGNAAAKAALFEVQGMDDGFIDTSMERAMEALGR